MAATPVPHRLADGRIRWRLAFRLAPGGSVTHETFDTEDAARRFGRLVDKIGGQAARDVRTASTTSAASMPTLATWLETHLTALGASDTTGTTAEYRRMARRTWLPTLGPMPLDAITREAVVAWVAAQRSTETERSIRRRTRAREQRRTDPTTPVPAPVTYSPKSIANAHGLLSGVLQSAVDAELITRNVAHAVALPSDAERPEMIILTQGEFVVLYAVVPPHWQPLVAVLYATGLRWGEATALRPSDLDLDAATPVLRVRRAWKKAATGVYLGSPKTRRGRRTVALPAQLVPVLRALAAGRPSDALLFTSTEGKRASAQHFNGRIWAPALKTSGIGKRPRVHDLRHTHASLMIAAGMNLLQLQHRLGHESLKVTGDTYGHLMPDALAAGGAFATESIAGAMPQIEA